MTPLHMAAERGCFDVVKYLVIDKGADVNIKDDSGVSICDSTAGSRLLLLAVSSHT